MSVSDWLREPGVQLPVKGAVVITRERLKLRKLLRNHFVELYHFFQFGRSLGISFKINIMKAQNLEPLGHVHFSEGCVLAVLFKNDLPRKLPFVFLPGCNILQKYFGFLLFS